MVSLLVQYCSALHTGWREALRLKRVLCYCGAGHNYVTFGTSSCTRQICVWVEPRMAHLAPPTHFCCPQTASSSHEGCLWSSRRTAQSFVILTPHDKIRVNPVTIYCCTTSLTYIPITNHLVVIHNCTWTLSSQSAIISRSLQNLSCFISIRIYFVWEEKKKNLAIVTLIDSMMLFCFQSTLFHRCIIRKCEDTPISSLFPNNQNKPNN